jgi:DNA-binding transcriptional ArsR family regulator
MGSWLIPADLLARSRFVISPMHETVAALTVLQAPAGPWELAFRAAHQEAYAAMLAADPEVAALSRRVWRPRRGDTPGWMADFLGLPPVGRNPSFEEELAQLGTWDDQRMRAELARLRPDPLPQELTSGGLPDALARLLAWVWSTTVVSDWPRRRRVLQADIVSRTSRLASHGWAGVIPTLGRKQRWLGDGRLQINDYDLPTRDLAQAEELSFVPVHSSGSWVSWDLPTRFALVYPVAGALAATAASRPAGLERMIGTNRARVLLTLDTPHSPTQLAALTGLPLGAVGNHLRVLLDAGTVLRRRSGREVLYWRSALGDGLAATTARPEH